MENLLDELHSLLYGLPVILASVILHECAHGLMAYALGDDTAKRAGRLTLNPLKHIDLMGLLSLIVLRFGWAKPVPVDPRNFKNRKLGMALTAIAGPLMNLIVATVSMFAVFAMLLFFPLNGVVTTLTPIIFYSVLINIGLAVFNLIPLPPLDGAMLLMPVLPRKAQIFIYKNQRYVQIILIVLMVTGILSKPLSIVRGWVFSGIEALVIWILP